MDINVGDEVLYVEFLTGRKFPCKVIEIKQDAHHPIHIEGKGWATWCRRSDLKFEKG